jgi:pyruvate formate lyase activating enzyme
MVQAARWWHTADNGKVVCTLCPRECHIPEGSRGFCFVRANEGGKLVLTTYGRSSGFCIDPIEKKPLNHFLPGTAVLSFGTAGCNLGCKFCQNWDISKSREIDTLSHQAGPEAIVAAAKRTGCRSLAYTYNDPVIWAEYAIDIAKVARREGIKNVAVTAGYMQPGARAEFYSWMDAANVDIKGFTGAFYRKLCQVELEPILDTIEYLVKQTDVWVELTNLMIPGENDSPQETAQLCAWMLEHLGPDVPIHFTAFHPDFKMMSTPHTPHATLIGARQIALNAGLHYAYVGNVHDLERESTYCPNCGQVVIGRDWYRISEYNLSGNRCAGCQRVIPGVFEEAAGQWGPKRVPISIVDRPVPLSVHGRS